MNNHDSRWRNNERNHLDSSFSSSSLGKASQLSYTQKPWWAKNVFSYLKPPLEAFKFLNILKIILLMKV